MLTMSMFYDLFYYYFGRREIPVATSSTFPNAGTATKDSPLLSFPPEILIEILRYLLISPLIVPLVLHNRLDAFGGMYSLDLSWTQGTCPFQPSELFRYRPSTGVLYTCRYLYATGSPIYYGANHFAIGMVRLPRFVSDFSVPALSKIRSLEVRSKEPVTDWPIQPLLEKFSGLERLIVDPPFIGKWHHFSGMKHAQGVPPSIIQRGRADVLKHSDPVAMADVTLDAEATASSALEDLILRHLPRLTGFWIKSRWSGDCDDSNPGFAAIRAESERELAAAVVTLIHQRERQQGGGCACQHTVFEDICCNECPLKPWKVRGKYRPMEAKMGNWTPPDPRPWDESSNFGFSGDAPFESFVKEDVWGAENTQIMHRLYENSAS